MNRKITIVFIFTILASCTNNEVKHSIEWHDQDLVKQLEEISIEEGISLEEAVVFGKAYDRFCSLSTAFHLGNPTYFNGNWLFAVYIGDYVSKLTDYTLALNSKTGKVTFNTSNITEPELETYEEIFTKCRANH